MSVTYRFTIPSEHWIKDGDFTLPKLRQEMAEFGVEPPDTLFGVFPITFESDTQAVMFRMKFPLLTVVDK